MCVCECKEENDKNKKTWTTFEKIDEFVIELIKQWLKALYSWIDDVFMELGNCPQIIISQSKETIFLKKKYTKSLKTK